MCRDANLWRCKIWRSGIERPHPPSKKKAMRPPPQIDLELPMFTLTLQREKRKKISEVFWGLPESTQVDFPMLTQRIRKVSKVHQSILKTNRCLIYWLMEIQSDSRCYMAIKKRKRLLSFLQYKVLWLTVLIRVHLETVRKLAYRGVKVQSCFYPGD